MLQWRGACKWTAPRRSWQLLSGADRHQKIPPWGWLLSPADADAHVGRAFGCGVRYLHLYTAELAWAQAGVQGQSATLPPHTLSTPPEDHVLWPLAASRRARLAAPEAAA